MTEPVTPPRVMEAVTLEAGVWNVVRQTIGGLPIGVLNPQMTVDTLIAFGRQIDAASVHRHEVQPGRPEDEGVPDVTA